MAQSIIVISHPEGSVPMTQSLHAETGNRSKAINRLMNYLAALAIGAKRASLKIGVAAVKASGTFSLRAAAADNTVLINGVTLTAKASPVGESQFGLGSNDNAAAANLVTKINAHSSALLDGVVSAAQTVTGVAEITEITAVADVAGSLHETYFILYDDAGSVGFWIDVDDAGGSAPAGATAADRQVEITTIATGDTAAVVAGKLETAIHADSKFNADSTDDVVTVTASTMGARTAPDEGDAGFSIEVATPGVTAVVTVTAANPGKLGNCMTLSATGAITASAARATGGTDGTEKTFSYGSGVTDL